MKLLNGVELVGFIKERQAKQVRSLKQANDISPRLAIIRTNPDPVVDSYMRLKQNYGEDVGIEVDIYTIEQPLAAATIEKLNKDSSIHGIIVQIPLPDKSQTDTILNTVSTSKDVDGLAVGSKFDPATPVAINWLLAGYNIELRGKKLVIVGNGRLVGKPLAKIWKNSSLDVTVVDKKTKNLEEITRQADVLVCATGKPGLITDDMVKSTVVIVDAGVATDTNGLTGDVAPGVRGLADITITPEKGGVGPLTVSALFDNVIRSARNTIKTKPQ